MTEIMIEIAKKYNDISKIMNQESFEGVVIGSGFGGTILALSLANGKEFLPR